jgi:hypothetical protein
VTEFRILGEITSIVTFAEESSIRDLPRLLRLHAVARWRKRKGVATVELANGQVRRVELHGYEAHGMGKTEMKIKCYLD